MRARLPISDRAPSRLGFADGALGGHPAFTLIEILVVVAIMAIVMTISVPFMNNSLNGGKGMNRAVKDVQEACKVAREWAILRQAPQELRIRWDNGIHFEVHAAATRTPGLEAGEMFSPGVDGREWRMENPTPVKGQGGGGSFSITLPESVQLEALLANGWDMTDTGAASVIFRPNGTCDELNLILFLPENNENRQVWLEVTTALAEVESDRSRFVGMNP